jgi:hypothetical protein
MKWKEFLKPDWKKIVFTAIIMYLTSYLSFDAPTFSNFVFGFPFTYFSVGVGSFDNGTFGIVSNLFFGFSSVPFRIHSFDYYRPIFGYAGFVLDVILWYLVVCFVFFFYDRIRKKK